MRNLHFIWALGLAGFLAMGTSACGDDDDGGGKKATGGTGGNTGGTGGGTGGSTGGSAGSTGGSAGSTGGSAGSTGGAAGSGGSAGGAGLSCDAYCTSIMASCTAANSQYTTNDACMAACATIPEGTAADTAGNTLGCRLYHAGAASADANTHCPHAGPAGVGTCGTNCEGYCNLMIEFCPSEYQNAADCTAKCAAFPGDDATDFDTSTQAGNSLQCRIYHATAAGLDAATHCAHAGVSGGGICG